MQIISRVTIVSVVLPRVRQIIALYSAKTTNKWAAMRTPILQYTIELVQSGRTMLASR